MDGVHDLGGKQGFGPIDVDEPEEPFHAEWEGREWAMSRTGPGHPDWSIDWWRHIRELIVPVDYLARPYFDSWVQTDMAAYIDSGVLTLDEIVTGKPQGPRQEPPPAITVSEAVARVAKGARRFDRESDAAPVFRVGDKVVTRKSMPLGHNRLPQYVRGRTGTIHAHHGAHVFPDMSARGVEEARHLYSVTFEAAELWPEATGSRDRVFLDLWESYLEPAG
jgi:nitrile hydratase